MPLPRLPSLNEDFDDTVEFLRGLDIVVEPTDGGGKEDDLFGLDAVAHLAKSLSWPIGGGAASGGAKAEAPSKPRFRMDAAPR